MAVALPLLTEKAAEWRSPLRAVDLLLLGYLGLVSAVAASRVHEQPLCWWLLLAHGLFVLLLFLVTRPGLGPIGRTIRELYPLFLLPGLYSELDIINSPGRPVYDFAVQHWEQVVFGMQISREWWQRYPSVFWSTVFHSAYLSYYLIISAPALYFAFKGDLIAVRRFVLIVMATFVVCYLFFIFFPVAGPYYMFPRPAAWFTANTPARLAYDALSSGSSYGAAFPSSHVAAALAATAAALRASRRLGLILLVPTALLTLGVVYCQMHYGVDALAGLLVGGLVTAIVGRMNRITAVSRER
ncbi:MAG TPA: phosphatase PAP2 family protein [Gemmatimonadales bacterium]|nr:phosphatase PAP2 family protein [Gemmatimonadales bacterium]